MRMVKSSEATGDAADLPLRRDKYQSWVRNLIWSAGLLLPWAVIAWFFLS
jgi:hypothetical protein